MLPGARLLQTTAGQVVVAILGLLVVVCLALLVYGVLELRLAWRVLRENPDSVLNAPNGGSVELVGTAEPGEKTLASPFTDTECLLYEYEVDEERHSNQGRSWATIASGTRLLPFRLEDDTGSVLVEPAGADLRLGRESTIRVDGGERPPEAIAGFIERDDRVDDQDRSIDLKLFEVQTGKDRRYVERRLDVGETVHVLGTARFDTSAARGSGHVNAVVGIDPDVLELGRVRWYLRRLLGPPFVISDTGERGTVGALATLGGALGLAILGLLLA